LSRPSLATFGLILVVALPSPALAQERTIPRSQLPPAVEHAVAALPPGTTIRGFSEEREGGRTYYEAELRVAGRSRDVLFDKDGHVVEVEEETALDSLPAPVRDSLKARAGSRRIVKVESLTKRDQLVAFEAQLDAGGKRSEVQVGPAGQTLSHEE
jgi:hypothetical protein